MLRHLRAHSGAGGRWLGAVGHAVGHARQSDMRSRRAGGGGGGGGGARRRAGAGPPRARCPGCAGPGGAPGATDSPTALAALHVILRLAAGARHPLLVLLLQLARRRHKAAAGGRVLDHQAVAQGAAAGGGGGRRRPPGWDVHVPPQLNPQCRRAFGTATHSAAHRAATSSSAASRTGRAMVINASVEGGPEGCD